MQLYIPINQNTIDVYPTTRLCYSPIYDSTPSFYKIFERGNNFLTREKLNQTLAGRKIEHLNSSYIPSKQHLANLTFAGIIFGLITAPFLALGGSNVLDPDYDQQVEVCKSRPYLLNDTVSNTTREATIFFPCPGQSFIWSSGRINTNHPNFAPLIFIGSSIFAAILTHFVGFFLFHYRQNSYNATALRFNKCLEEDIEKLSFASNLNVEVTARDIGITFPYLKSKQLFLLKFSHLKKAKKHWGELFQKKLDSALFSKQQLSIWRLFQHIIDADEKTQRKILSNQLYQNIIGSEPLFFQAVVRHVVPLTKDDKKTNSLSKILKEKILTLETASRFDEEDYHFIIIETAKGEKLKQLIDEHVNNMDGSDSREDFSFSENVSDEAEVNYGPIDDIQPAFDVFLKTGKLNIQSYCECYNLLKFAIKRNQLGIAVWLESYLSTDISEFLKDQEMSVLLKELDSLNLDSLKLKIDQYLEDEWEVDILNFCSDDFGQRYVFAIEHDLSITSKNLKECFIACLRNYKFEDPFDGMNATNFIGQILDKCEILFEEEKNPIIELLKVRVVSFLKKNPKIIENFAEAAKNAGNQWLMDVIKSVYEQNPQAYSMYWLSPFEDDIVLTVI